LSTFTYVAEGKLPDNKVDGANVYPLPAAEKAVTLKNKRTYFVFTSAYTIFVEYITK
jgi:hypothetical protein